MTPIKSISKEEIKYFGDVTEKEFWLEIQPQRGAAQTGSTAVQNVRNHDYTSKIKNCLDFAPGSGVICIFTGELSSKPVCEILAKARDNGNRIYILTNDHHQEMKNLEGCLIRCGGGKRLGSFILVNPNTNGASGCIFTGLLSDGSLNKTENLLLDLDSEQIQTLFRFFCFHFWNNAEKEHINGVSHNTDSAPLDIYPPTDDSCDFGYLTKIWSKRTENAYITVSGLNENSYLKFSSFYNSNIVSLLSGIDNNLVRSLKDKNNNIFINEDVSLVNSVKTNEEFWLIPKTDTAQEEEVYSIKLNSEQEKILNEYIIFVMQNKVIYQYFKDEKRESLSGKSIFHLGESVSQKYTVNPEVRKIAKMDEPKELLPMNDFENQHPLFDDDGCSVSIIYEWTNIPYTLPKGSNKHQLYKNWEDEERKIKLFIDTILDNISEIVKSENKFKLIARIFLGKKQKFKEYENDLRKLKDENYRYIKKEEELKEKIKKINELKNIIANDSNEINEENRQAEIKENIIAKEKEIKIYSKELDEKEKELKETEKEINKYIIDQKNLEKQHKILKDKAEKEKTKKDEKEKTDIEKTETENPLINYDNLLKDLNDNINKIKKELIRKNINKNNITGQKKEIEKKIKENENYIKNENEKLKKIPKETAEKKSSLKNLDAGGKMSNKSGSTNILPVPNLQHLPVIGEFYNHNGQDYLAINDWDDYDKGKEEVKRLSAKLCAKGE